MASSDLPAVLTSDEMASYLRISRGQLDQLAMQPGCPAYHVGSGDKQMTLRWPREGTEAWLAGRKRQPKQMAVHKPAKTKAKTKAEYLAAADAIKAKASGQR